MTISLLIVLALLLVVLNIFFLKKKSPVAKVMISVGFLAGLIVLYLFVIVVLWNSGKNPREEERQYKNHNANS